MARKCEFAVEIKRPQMKIEHIAIWVSNIEKMRQFYTHYFDAKAGAKYVNQKKNFTSYFMSFQEGPRLELMHKPEILEGVNSVVHLGLIHFAISVGTKQKVDNLTEQLRTDGCKIASEPRTTGDGYYESVVLDPENNRVEITI